MPLIFLAVRNAMKTADRSFSETFQERNLRYLENRTPQKTSTIGFLLLENFSLPSFTQALDALTTANLIRPGTVKTHTFSHTGAEVMSDLSIPIRPDTPLTDLRLLQLDLMVICGGLRTPRQVPGWLTALLRKVSAMPMALGGLWNGAWYMGDSGLLDGYKCAIHSEQRTALAERAPNANVSLDSMILDRNRLTAATPAGAFQMMIGWLRERSGSELAHAVMDLLDYDQSRFKSALNTLNPKLNKPLREIVTLMESNLEDPLDIRQLSQCSNLSVRQVQRLFKSQLDTTPQRYYLQLRITEARRLLQNSSLSVIETGLACGFVSTSHFSRCYREFFGHSPSREFRHEL